MKILFAATSVYFPSFGGASKANRAIAEQLAARGHQLQALGPALSCAGYTDIEEYRAALAAEGIEPRIVQGVGHFERNGVSIYAPANMRQLLDVYRLLLEEFSPDCVLLTSEDWQMGLLEIALEYSGPAIAPLVHGAISLPFGPIAMRPNGWGKNLFGQAHAVIAPSHFIADYIHKYSDIDATVIHLPAYPLPPSARRASFDNPFVTIINPSAGKGIDIFLEMTRRLPDVAFAAVPTWATTETDLANLRQRPNVTILNRTAHIDEVWEQTRIALMPSLWPEAFPLTPTEAMLHGIPVLASDAGGTPEAMLGADFVLPVQIMQGWEDSDNPFLPTPVVPKQRPQDLDQWERALHLLVEDRQAWEAHSIAAHDAAVGFVDGLSVAPFEQLFERIVAKKRRAATSNAASLRSSPSIPNAELATLSPDKRALLQQWLRAQQIGAAQPKNVETTSGPRHPAQPLAEWSPASETLVAVAEIWADVFGRDDIDVNEPLSALNGHPLVTAEIVQGIRELLAPGLPASAIFEHPTIVGLASFIEQKHPGLEETASGSIHLLPLRTIGSRPPIFFTSGGGGSEAEYLTAYAGLVHALGGDQPIYGFVAQTMAGIHLPFDTVPEMVAAFICEMRQVQPHGPYFLVGECVGAKVAFEMARQLSELGQEIGLLLFLNGEAIGPPKARTLAQQAEGTLKNRLTQLRKTAPENRLARVQQMTRNTLSTFLPITEKQRRFQAERSARKGYLALLLADQPRTYRGGVEILMTQDIQARGEPQVWHELTGGEMSLKDLVGIHKGYLGENLAENMQSIREKLNTAQARWDS